MSDTYPSNRRPVSRRDLLRGGVSAVASSLLLQFAGPNGPGVAAAGPKRIYIAPDDHTDYLWTGDEETYRLAFLEMIDYYLDLADATAANPSDFQSRWNCDGSFWMWTYERNRTPAQFERFIAQLRSHHMSVPLTALVSCLGGVPAEAVLRGMYYPGQIERRYNLRFPLAVCMENQTLPYGLGALWAGAGAQFSWRGICGCATRVPFAGDREHEIYWWVGADGSRVLMKWHSLTSNESIGGYAEARNPAAVIEYVDTEAGFRARYPFDVIGAFGKGWDDLKTLTDEFVTVAQAKSNAGRRVIVSDERDFFEDFQATYGAQLPSLSCSFGNEWDLYCASLAELSATVKRALEKLRSAEALATLVTRHTPGFMDSRREARDQCWMALGLYWEHNWTADGPISRADRAAWQRRIAALVTGYVDALYDDAAAALASQIATSGANPRFFVFNPLGWERTDIADLPYTSDSPVHVVDVATGSEVPSQAIVVDGQRRLRILSERVPSIGYKVFEVRTGAGQAFTPAATVDGGAIEHAIYRLVVAANGAITSLVDKRQANREFARAIDGRTINDLGASAGTLQLESVGPVSVTLLATADGPLAHTTRVTLTRGSDRIAIENVITQNFSDVRSWSFAFNLDAPDVWHEEVGAVIRARLLPQGGHYAARNARYDWLTLNHFA
ncbi:MAG: glycoside hydrolase, partial [Chloroflexales bacterium]|nr:glycoside hydrolase [Chloroflexales bacterium]